MHTRDGILVRELEAQSLRVVAQVLDCSQLQVNPSLVAANKHLRALLGLCGRALLCVSVHADTQTNGTDCEGDGLQVVALGSLGGVFAKALRGGLAQF